MAIWKERSGRFRVSIKDKNGKRKSLGTFETKTQAKRAEAKAYERRDDGKSVRPDRIQLDDVFALYIRSCDDRGLSGTTIHRYEQLWNSYARERIGKMIVSELSVLKLERLYGELLRSGGTTRRGRAKDAAPGVPRPLSVRTVQHVHGLLQAMLNWALRMEVVTVNAAAIARAPSGARKKGRAFQIAEVDALLDTAEQYRVGPLVAFALETGLRRGELAALKWTDIDYDRTRATIRASVAQIPGRLWVKSTKQDLIKDVALSSSAIAALHAQKKQQEVERLAAGASYRDDGYVFAPPLGGFASPGSIGNAVRRVARRAGLTLTKLHATRHTTATVLIRQGEDLATVAAVLRHSSTATTLSVYGHEVVDAQQLAVERAAAERRERKVRRLAAAAENADSETA